MAPRKSTRARRGAAPAPAAPPAAPPAVVPKLPAEVINIILKQVSEMATPGDRETRKDLRSCALVCKEWSPFAQTHLFLTIVIDSKVRAQKLAASPALGRYRIRELEVQQLGLDSTAPAAWVDSGEDWSGALTRIVQRSRDLLHLHLEVLHQEDVLDSTFFQLPELSGLQGLYFQVDDSVNWPLTNLPTTFSFVDLKVLSVMTPAWTPALLGVNILRAVASSLCGLSFDLLALLDPVVPQPTTFPPSLYMPHLEELTLWNPDATLAQFLLQCAPALVDLKLSGWAPDVRDTIEAVPVPNQIQDLNIQIATVEGSKFKVDVAPLLGTLEGELSRAGRLHGVRRVFFGGEEDEELKSFARGRRFLNFLPTRRVEFLDEFDW